MFEPTSTTPSTEPTAAPEAPSFSTDPTGVAEEIWSAASPSESPLSTPLVIVYPEPQPPITLVYKGHEVTGTLVDAGLKLTTEALMPVFSVSRLSKLTFLNSLNDSQKSPSLVVSDAMAALISSAENLYNQFSLLKNN